MCKVEKKEVWKVIDSLIRWFLRDDLAWSWQGWWQESEHDDEDPETDGNDDGDNSTPIRCELMQLNRSMASIKETIESIQSKSIDTRDSSNWIQLFWIALIIN